MSLARKNTTKPKVSLGGMNVENDLPYPVVHYPNHYGTICSFSYRKNSIQHICSCAVPALKNLIRFSKSDHYETHEEESTRRSLDSVIPKQIAELINEYQTLDLGYLSIKDDICHRCCLITPEWRWCHHMYHSKFQQIYGWYIEQDYLKLGIQKMGTRYLKSKCPKRYRVLIDELNHLISTTPQKTHSRSSISDRATLPKMEIISGKIQYNYPKIRRSKFSDNRDRIKELKRQLSHSVENITRRQFGHRDMGKEWTSETMLFNLVQQIFKNRTVRHHYRAHWLGQQEIDIFIPDEKLAIEYQGQQHYEAVELWGGEEGLANAQERDERKQAACKHQGVQLIEFSYEEVLTLSNVRKRLNEAGIKA